MSVCLLDLKLKSCSLCGTKHTAISVGSEKKVKIHVLIGANVCAGKCHSPLWDLLLRVGGGVLWLHAQSLTPGSAQWGNASY